MFYKVFYFCLYRTNSLINWKQTLQVGYSNHLSLISAGLIYKTYASYRCYCTEIYYSITNRIIHELLLRTVFFFCSQYSIN